MCPSHTVTFSRFLSKRKHMSKNLIAINKKEISEIKAAYSKFLGMADQTMQQAFATGNLLLKLKEKTPHGQWITFLNAAFDGVFEPRHAQKLMSIAANKALVLEVAKGEILSINEMTKVIAEATPEQLERVKQIEAEHRAAEEKRRQEIETEKQRKADEAKIKSEEENIISKVQTKDEPIEGEFTQVQETKAAKKQEEKKPEYSEEQMQIAEAHKILSERNDELEAEILSLSKIFESNDKLKTASAEVKKLTALNSSLESQIRSYQNERSELIKTAKSWRLKYEKLAKENGVTI